MDLNSIMDKTFTEAMRGYKKEEVEEYLGELAREFSQLQKENVDLEKKLQVCADKIREYREDEEALKDALLGAQKAGNAIIAECKEKAAGIVQEAEEKADELRKEADDYVASKKEEGEKIVEEALKEKARIEEEATKTKEDIHAQMEIQTELDKEALARTKRESEDFRTRLIVEYQNHIEMIKKMPEICFNEFVVNTANEHSSNTLRELIAAQQGIEVPQIPEAVEEAVAAEETSSDEDVKVVESYSDIQVSENESEEITEETVEEAPAEDTAEAAVEMSDDEGTENSFTVENAFGVTESDAGEDEEEEDDVPDFLRSKPNRNNNSKYDKLEFGSNNDSNKNNNNYHHKKKRR
ncbi:MAG: DivIVA domain-containing protein [Ruminiclostridium sp.]|nr:DivIVA domain-containing protein [Ruminiclostridium sp.]